MELRSTKIRNTRVKRLVYCIFTKYALPVFAVLGVSTVGMMIAAILTNSYILYVAPMFTGYTAVIYAVIYASIRIGEK